MTVVVPSVRFTTRVFATGFAGAGFAAAGFVAAASSPRASSRRASSRRASSPRPPSPRWASPQTSSPAPQAASSRASTSPPMPQPPGPSRPPPMGPDPSRPPSRSASSAPARPAPSPSSPWPSPSTSAPSPSPRFCLLRDLRRLRRRGCPGPGLGRPRLRLEDRELRLDLGRLLASRPVGLLCEPLGLRHRILRGVERLRGLLLLLAPCHRPPLTEPSAESAAVGVIVSRDLRPWRRRRVRGIFAGDDRWTRPAARRDRPTRGIRWPGSYAPCSRRR